MSSLPASSRLRFHRDFYRRQAIDAATATFADFASFQVDIDGDHFVVDIDNVSSNVEGDVIAEFGNFVLANTIGLRDGQAAEAAA